MKSALLISISTALMAISSGMVPEDEVSETKSENIKTDTKKTLPIIEKIQIVVSDVKLSQEEVSVIEDLDVKLTDRDHSALMYHPEILELEKALTKAVKPVENLCRRDFEIRFRKVSEEIQQELSRMMEKEYLEEVKDSLELALEELHELKMRIEIRMEERKKESAICLNDESKCDFIVDLISEAEYALYTVESLREPPKVLENHFWELFHSDKISSILSERLIDPVEDCMHRFG